MGNQWFHLWGSSILRNLLVEKAWHFVAKGTARPFQIAERPIILGLFMVAGVVQLWWWLFVNIPTYYIYIFLYLFIYIIYYISI